VAGDYVKVAKVSDLQPGEMMRVEVHKERVLLVNVNGKFHAICDTCSHEDASLYMGALHGEYVRCPLHGSRFSVVTGEPLEEPAEIPVAVYPVRIEGDDVLLGPKYK